MGTRIEHNKGDMAICYADSAVPRLPGEDSKFLENYILRWDSPAGRCQPTKGKRI